MRFLIASFVFTFAADFAAESAAAAWPPGWTELYERLERFLAAKKSDWPPSGLILGEHGEIIHGVPLVKDRTTHLSLAFFHRGKEILSKGMSTELFGESRNSYFSPGQYAVYLKSSSDAGYQTHLPLVWFETYRNDAGSRDSDRLRIRLTEPPAPGDAVWPNERLLGFLDLHVITAHRNPNEIKTINALAEPAVQLRVDDHGVIERDLLAEENAEAPLRWRIYHDGTLIEQGSAAGMTRWEPPSAVGTYLALVGVEGPAGFLPVSNLLEFPLFPEADGTFTPRPTDRDGDRTPDFVAKILGPHPAETLLADDGDADNDGLSNREESSLPRPAVPAHSGEDDQKLLRLWNSWAYEVEGKRRAN